jgi:hypothetical protein
MSGVKHLLLYVFKTWTGKTFFPSEHLCYNPSFCVWVVLTPNLPLNLQGQWARDIFISSVHKCIAWATQICRRAECTVGQSPLLGILSRCNVRASITLFLATILLTSSRVHVLKVFPNVMQTWQRSVEEHLVRFDEVTGVKAWGKLTKWQTWCLNSLPFALSQAPCGIQTFLQSLWS